MKNIRILLIGVGILLLLCFIFWLSKTGQESKLPIVSTAQKPTKVDPFLNVTSSAAIESSSRDLQGESSNAADLYKKAFALYGALSEEEKKIIGKGWKAEVDPDIERELCAKLRPICDFLHEAAKLPGCDWDLDLIHVDTPLTHINPSYNLMKSSLWFAAHGRAGDTPGIVEDLTSALKLGQNTSGILIGHLINSAGQQMVIDFVAEKATGLSLASNKGLLESLTNSQYEEGFYRSMEKESKSILQIADEISRGTPEGLKLSDSIKNAARKSLIESLPAATDPNQGINDPAQQIAAPAKLHAALKQIADLELEYIEVLQQPESSYKSWLDRLKKVEDQNPLVSVLMPQLDGVVEKSRATVIKRKMAEAGLLILEGGPSAAISCFDPATGKPFIYTQTDQGIEIQSAYEVKGAPLKLLFR